MSEVNTYRLANWKAIINDRKAGEYAHNCIIRQRNERLMGSVVKWLGEDFELWRTTI